MEKLRELVELAELAKESGQRPKDMVEFRERANPDAILAISEAFRELELAHCGGALLERELHHVEVIKEILKYNSVLEAKLATTIPDGWKLVPIEPTRQMMSQGHFALGGTDRGKFRRIYQAMIAAAPEVGE